MVAFGFFIKYPPIPESTNIFAMATNMANIPKTPKSEGLSNRPNIIIDNIDIP